MLKVYLFMIVGWLALTVTGILQKPSTLRRYLLRFSYVVLLFFSIELGCVLAFYFKNHRWTFNDERGYLRELFEPHPYLTAVPRKNAHVANHGISYTHNSQGYRGREFAPKSQRVRIIAMGGSTTYGAAVSDDQTWPVYLEGLLGSDYEVLNFGVLGFSTVEHITQAALIVPEYQPDVLIVHAGFNDLRNLHIKGLAADYSDYQGPSRYATLELCPEEGLPRFASLRVAVWVLQQVKVYPPCEYSRFPPPEDQSPAAADFAKYLYRRNLETLVTLAKKQGLRPILVPQVLVRERFEGGRLRWWIPYVPDDQLITELQDYNRIMQEVANQEGLAYVQAVTLYPWTKDDFADASHLNGKGNYKFAQLLKDVVSEERRKVINEYKTTNHDSVGNRP
jgi:lysophospholipase L1-like esterase